VRTALGDGQKDGQWPMAKRLKEPSARLATAGRIYIMTFNLLSFDYDHLTIAPVSRAFSTA
jgi:hypothetical protein